MDRPSLSGVIIQELAEVFVAELTRAAPALLRSDLAGIERQVQVIGRRVLGRVVEQVVAVRAAAEARCIPDCEACQRPMRRVDGARPRHLQGLVGDYTLARAYVVCDQCHQGRAPLDAVLGIGSGALSPGLARVACRAGIEGSFGEGTSVLQETLGVDVPPEAIRRITEGIGAVAEAAQQAAVARGQRGAEPIPAAAVVAGGAVLVVEVDGCQVHLDDAWHEMKVGVVGPLGPATRLDEQTGRRTLLPGPASYCAGLEAAEVFWYRVYAAACQRGLGTRVVSRVVVLGDGADWIWHYAARFLGVGRVEVIEIVDLYHAWQHLWTIAHAVFGTGTADAVAWAAARKRDLLTAGAPAILTALAALAPAAETAAEEVRKAVAYFTTHAARMDYPTFMAQQLPIGSGAVESACKTLIEAREKGAGMRWSRPGAQHVATLRAVHRSDEWEAFWQTHPQRRRPAVFPRRQTVLPRLAQQPVAQAA
jgi:hypothetical protein